MEMLLDRMRREAARERGNHGKTECGLITSYDDTGSWCVKVLFPDTGKETAWIPLGSSMVGNGWGVFFAPSIGDQVVVEYQEDHPETPIATVRIFDDVNRALAVPSGEIWMVHKSGSYIKLTSDGKITLNAVTEIDAGSAGSAFKTLATEALMAVYNSHTHAVIGSVTGIPQQPLTSAQFTTVLKAN